MYEIFLNLLNEKGVKVVDVCKATGISQASMTGWKQGRTTPKTENLKKIADYFGVSVSVFFPKLDNLPNEEPQIHYIDHQTAEVAQAIMENPLLRVLFNEASTAEPEDIQASYDTLMAMKRKARHYD